MLKEHLAIKQLKRVTKKYPNILDSMAKLRARGSGRESWQFLSESEMLSQLARLKTLKCDKDSMTQKYTDILVAIWGITKGIYRFDQDAFNAIMSTSDIDKLPVEVFLRLPEWCIYIESQGLYFGEHQLHGFFVSILGDEKPEDIVIAMIHKDGVEIMLLSLGGKSVPDMIRPISTQLAENDPFVDQVKAILSLVIFISTQQQEINGEPKRQEASKTKLGYQVRINHELKEWLVGERIGQAIRLSEASDSRESTKRAAHERSLPRPHVRRAHWHGYWCGEGRCQYKLNWIPPTLINISDNLPATVRKVKSK